METSGQTRKAQPRERMIEVKLRFWTNEIADQKGYIVPKHAWASGVVVIKRNESHGIIPENPRHFNSLMELPQVIERVLIDHGITLHLDRKMAKYIK